jgi:2-polyprenyl-3-methyl-5-hydroxy-6-metoxy-1,4-benzoquinol methylase
MFDKRTKDIVTQNEDLELLYTFKNFPVLMGCTNQDRSLDIMSDMEFGISKSSGMIQVLDLISLDFLYAEAHVSGVLGNIWKSHHESFAEFIHKYDRKNIIEIGGQHGILHRSYKKINQNFKWTMIDPDPSKEIDAEVNVIKGFYDENTIIDPESDCIVHSHFFEHLHDPRKFLNQISKSLDNKIMIFSVPNLDKWFKKKYYQTLNFEHTFLFNEYFIKKLLNQNNLEIIDIEYYCNDHSIFYAVKNSLSVEPIESKNYYFENKKSFEDFINYKKNIISKINKFSSNKKIYIFGAHVNTQFSCNFGLNTENVICLLDNCDFKHNKRLYGTNLVVQKPSIFQDDLDVIVIVDTGKYNDEIIKSLVERYPHIRALSIEYFAT